MMIVSGASGQLGRLVVGALIEAGAAGRVRALTRDPGKLAEFAARGVEVRRGDFDDPAGLPDAFDGGTTLLLISTDNVGGGRVAQHRAAVDAARSAGIGQILYTSIPRPDPSSPVAVVPDHAATEDLIRASGLGWTMLRNSLYAESLLYTRAITPEGLVGNNGPGRISYVTRLDCAAAAAAVLLDPAPHAGRAYDITGPSAPSPSETAALLAEVAGRPVPRVDLDDAAFAAELVKGGIPAFYADLIASFGRGTREGWLESVSTAVPDLTGRPATPLRDFLHAHRAEVVAALGG